MGLNFEDVLRANDEMSEAIQRVRELGNRLSDNHYEKYTTSILPPGSLTYEQAGEQILRALDGEQ